MNKKSLLAKIIAACAVLLCTACFTKHLRKYDRNADGGNPELYSNNDPTLPKDGSEKSDKNKAKKSSAAEPVAAQRASIYAVDNRTFRFSLKDKDVWDAAINVLMRNYNLIIVDKENGIITTEWDSYYLNNAVFRNKLSMRLGKNQWNTVDLIMHNNVEKLKDASQAVGAVGAVWLPAEDPGSEINRLIQNMALVLEQPPPVLPPQGAIARQKDKGDKSSF